MSGPPKRRFPLQANRPEASFSVTSRFSVAALSLLSTPSELLHVDA